MALSNAAVAYQAAAYGEQLEREADITPRQQAYFAWLEAQPTTSAAVIANAQAALLGAALAYVGRPSQDPTADVTAHASQLLADITAATQGHSS